jgi:hypothetical protein
MVLVSYTLANYISILQTKFSNREGHEARRVRLETMPLDQHIEGRHGKREPRLKIRLDPVHDLLEVAHDGQHGEHRLDEHRVAGKSVRKYTLSSNAFQFNRIQGNYGKYSGIVSIPLFLRTSG